MPLRPYSFIQPGQSPCIFCLSDCLDNWKRDSETDKTAPLIRLSARPGSFCTSFYRVLALLGIGGSLSCGKFVSIEVFERFYRYGYLVFGGGQVVVPLMQGELVHLSKLDDPAGIPQWVRSGSGHARARCFLFAAYAGGLCEQAGSATRQIKAGAFTREDVPSFSQVLFCSFLFIPSGLELQQAKWASPLPHRNQCRCGGGGLGKRGIRTDRTQPGMEQVSHFASSPLTL